VQHIVLTHVTHVNCNIGEKFIPTPLSQPASSSQLVRHSWIVTSMVLTWNRMSSSEILYKCHSCCIENGKCHSASPHEIYPHFQYNTCGIYPKFYCYPCYRVASPFYVLSKTCGKNDALKLHIFDSNATAQV